jgi:hypothetical protein
MFGESVPEPLVVIQYPPILFVAAALNVAEAFAQTIWFGVTDTVGPVLTFTTTWSWFVQPFAPVPVTVYVVVAFG